MHFSRSNKYTNRQYYLHKYPIVNLMGAIMPLVKDNLPVAADRSIVTIQFCFAEMPFNTSESAPLELSARTHFNKLSSLESKLGEPLIADTNMWPDNYSIHIPQKILYRGIMHIHRHQCSIRQCMFTTEGPHSAMQVTANTVM